MVSRLYVVEKPGVIRVLINGKLRARPFLDIRSRVGSSDSEQGLLSMAFHPNYRNNHRFYVDYTDRNGDTRVVQFRSNGAVGLPGTARQLLFVNQPYANHNGGQLQFGPDGRLYVGMGDGGSGGDPQNHAQTLSSRLGKLLRLNYAAQNGHPYLAVGRVLIERGIVPQDEMTMDKIRTFIAEDPDQGRELMRMNRSYVFFREMEELPPDAEPVGAQGIPLTRGRSIAVDKSIHAYGTPFWIEAELPLERENGATPFRRLVFAQDTGGAIVGPARADIYFGAGIDAGTVAGRLRHFGRVFMLVPRPPEPRLAAVPLPLPRPKR
jgi:3D (Asp-Asp-Asp) domain-containing protein